MRESRPSETDEVRVGVVSFHNSKETKAICNAITALGHEPVWIARSNLRSSITDGTVVIEPQVDAAINRLLVTKSRNPLCELSLAGVVADRVPTLNPPDAVAGMLHKHRAAAELARAGVPVPDTLLAPDREPPADWPTRVGEPAVRKPGIGTNGTDVARVEAGDAAYHSPGYLLQRFHPSDGDRHADVRAYVVDGEAVAAMRRTAPSDDWRSNVAVGGETADVTDELSATAVNDAVRATETLGLDAAGVDLVRDGDGWAVLEVNATAGFKGLYDATGVSVAPSLAAAAIRRAGGRVDSDAVREAATRLDDSLPDCAPDDVLVGESGLVGSVGYATRVRLAGRTGATETTAKSDTGADRTTLDLAVAEEVGAGPITDTTTVRSGGGTETRPVVPVSLRLGGEWHDVAAGVTDRSDNSHDVLLGRDVLEQFRIDPRLGPEE